MSDQDREAFNKWCEREHFTIHFPALWQAWQAARDHYAPKLTFKEAIEKAGDAVERLVSRGRFPGDSEFDYALEMSAAAFRAAGVQFRDEPNPEPGACQ